MKKLSIIFAIMLFATAAWAGQSITIGDTTYHYFDDGTMVTTTKIGNTYHHSGDVNGTSTRIGNTMNHSFDKPKSSRPVFGWQEQEPDPCQPSRGGILDSINKINSGQPFVFGD
jgi:hypothetical protein